MAHIGKQIADAFVTALTGQTEAGGDVTLRRFWPAEKELSADVIVHVEGEEIETRSTSPSLYLRRFTVSVTGRFKGAATTLESRGFAFATAVEQAIEGDAALAALAPALSLRRVETTGDGSGDQPVLLHALIYEVQALTRAGDPETAL